MERARRSDRGPSCVDHARELTRQLEAEATVGVPRRSRADRRPPTGRGDRRPVRPGSCRASARRNRPTRRGPGRSTGRCRSPSGARSRSPSPGRSLPWRRPSLRDGAGALVGAGKPAEQVGERLDLLALKRSRNRRLMTANCVHPAARSLS